MLGVLHDAQDVLKIYSVDGIFENENAGFVRIVIFTRLKNLDIADDVESFVTFYKALRKDYPVLILRDDVLILRFEDMIYDYDKTSKRIMDFLGLDESQIMLDKKERFNPEKSIVNTQLFNRYPQYSKDVEFIENELSECLYNFPGNKKIDFEGDLF